MATAYDWIKLLLENSKHLIAVYAILFGVTGYTIYDKVSEPEIVKTNPEKSVKIEPKQVVIKEVKHSHKKLMVDHVDEFH